MGGQRGQGGTSREVGWEVGRESSQVTEWQHTPCTGWTLSDYNRHFLTLIGNQCCLRAGLIRKGAYRLRLTSHLTK